MRGNLTHAPPLLDLCRPRVPRSSRPVGDGGREKKHKSAQPTTISPKTGLSLGSLTHVLVRVPGLNVITAAAQAVNLMVVLGSKP